MPAIRINDIPLFQVDLPSMTLAQYNALPEADRPKHWIRTDLEYRNIPASMVDLSNGQTVEQAVNRGSVYVYADGVKTLSALLNELHALIDTTKLTFKSYLTDGVSKFTLNAISGTEYYFDKSNTTANMFTNITLGVKASGSTIYTVGLDANNTSFSDTSAYVPTAGTSYSLYY